MSAAAETILSDALPQRREDAATRVVELRRERGAAIVDGTPFDSRPIVEAETTLDAIFDAEGALADRQRAAAAQEERERREKVRGELSSASEAFEAAVVRAEISAKEMSGALRAVFASARKINTNLSILPTRGGISISELANQLGYRLAASLANIVHPVSFGQISFRPGAFPADEKWIVAAKRVCDGIDAAIAKGERR